MERIRLNQHTTQIQLPEELLEHCPLMVLARGVAGLSDRHAQCSGVERQLGNESRASTSRGLDGAPQRLTITNKQIEIRCTTRDLSDCPVPDGSTEGGTSTCRKK